MAYSKLAAMKIMDMAIIKVTYVYSILYGHFVVKYPILGSFRNIKYNGMPSIFKVEGSGTNYSDFIIAIFDILRSGTNYSGFIITIFDILKISEY